MLYSKFNIKLTKERKMGKCEDCIFISIGLSIKFLEMFVMFTGPVLVVGVYILFGLHAYGFLVQYTLYYFPQRNIYTTAVS